MSIVSEHLEMSMLGTGFNQGHVGRFRPTVLRVIQGRTSRIRIVASSRAGSAGAAIERRLGAQHALPDRRAADRARSKLRAGARDRAPSSTRDAEPPFCSPKLRRPTSTNKRGKHQRGQYRRPRLQTMNCSRSAKSSLRLWPESPSSESM